MHNAFLFLTIRPVRDAEGEQGCSNSRARTSGTDSRNLRLIPDATAPSDNDVCVQDFTYLVDLDENARQRDNDNRQRQQD